MTGKSAPLDISQSKFVVGRVITSCSISETRKIDIFTLIEFHISCNLAFNKEASFEFITEPGIGFRLLHFVSSAAADISPQLHSGFECRNFNYKISTFAGVFLILLSLCPAGTQALAFLLSSISGGSTGCSMQELLDPHLCWAPSQPWLLTGLGVLAG